MHSHEFAGSSRRPAGRKLLRARSARERRARSRHSAGGRACRSLRRASARRRL